MAAAPPVSGYNDIAAALLHDNALDAQKQQDDADAASLWNTAAGAMAALGNAGKAVGAFAENVAITSPPGQIVEDWQHGESALSGGAWAAVKAAKATNVATGFKPPGKVEEALIAGLGSTAEWVGVGKAAALAEHFLITPALKGSFQIFRELIKPIREIPIERAEGKVARELANVAVGEEYSKETLTKSAATVVRKQRAMRVASSAIAGAGIGAGYGVARRDSKKDVAVNTTLGMVFGALAGAYSPALRGRILNNVDDLVKMGGPNSKHVLDIVNRVSDTLARQEELPAHEAAKTVVRALLGETTDAESIAVLNALNQHPEILRTPFGVELFENVKREKAPFSPVDFPDRPPSAEPNFELRGPNYPQAYRAPNPRKMLAVRQRQPSPAVAWLQAKGIDESTAEKIMNEVTRQASSRDDLIGAMFRRPVVMPAQTPPRLTHTIFADEAPFAVEPPEILPAEMLPPDFAHVNLEDGARVVAGPATLAGTPVGSAAGVQHVLPPFADVHHDIPNAPLVAPEALSVNQRALWHQAVNTDDWAAFERAINRNKHTRSSLIRMSLNGMLQPSHIQSSDMARTISGALRDEIDKIPQDNLPKRTQLAEKALSFLQRAYTIRNEPIPDDIAASDFLREPDSGDIVRTVGPPGASTVHVVDKHGRSTAMRREDLPPQSYALYRFPEGNPFTEPSANAAEYLKRIEAAIGNNEEPPTFAHPVKPLGIGPDFKRLERLKKIWGQVQKKVKKGEKGALTIPRGKRITDTVAAHILTSADGAMFELPEGVVVELNGKTYLFSSRAEADRMVFDTVSAGRILAEQRQVLDDAFPEKAPQHPRDYPKVAGKRARVHIVNPAALTRTISQLSRFGADRPANVIDKMFSLTPLTRMQKVTLRRLDADTASHMERYEMLFTMLHRNMRDRARRAAAFLSKSGIDGDAIEQRTASPEMLQIWDKTIGQVFNENHELLKAAGKPVAKLITDRQYFPHMGWIKGEHVVPFVDDAKRFGLIPQNAGPEELARIVNEPAAIAEPPEGSPEGAMLEYQNRLRFAADVRQAIAPTLEKARHGVEGWDRNILNVVDKKLYEDARAIAQAYVFGPALERIDEGIGRIRAGAAFGGNQEVAYKALVNDMLGNVASTIYDTATKRVFANLTTGLVSGSAPRHVFQSTLMLMRFATTPAELLRTVIAPARAFADYVRNNDRYGFTHAIGASLELERNEIETTPGKFLSTGSIERGSEKLRSLFLFPLHVTINVERAFTANVARYQFDHFYEAAMRGDKNALGVLQKALKANVPAEALKNMDYESLRQTFAHSSAATVGTTFYPGDFPAFTRGGLGWLWRFRTFLNTMPYNFLQEFSNPNLSPWRKARMAGIVIAALPTIGAIDPRLRHSVRFIGNTIDSAVAYDAWERWHKDFTNLGKLVYAEIALGMNTHLLGILSDTLQGVNIHNEDRMRQLARLDATTAAQALTLLIAGDRIAYGIQQGSSKDVRTGIVETLGTLGGVGQGIERMVSEKKPVRIPKHMVFRKALHAGE